MHEKLKIDLDADIAVRALDLGDEDIIGRLDLALADIRPALKPEIPADRALTLGCLQAAAAIDEMAKDADRRTAIAEAGRIAVAERFDRRKLADRYRIVKARATNRELPAGGA